MAQNLNTNYLDSRNNKHIEIDPDRRLDQTCYYR
jgi:hypothetical protein